MDRLLWSLALIRLVSLYQGSLQRWLYLMADG